MMHIKKTKDKNDYTMYGLTAGKILAIKNALQFSRDEGIKSLIRDDVLAVLEKYDVGN